MFSKAAFPRLLKLRIAEGWKNYAKSSTATYWCFNNSSFVLCLCYQLYLWGVFYNPLYRHLNEFIKGVQLLTYKTLFIKICTDDNPTRFLPQICSDIIPIIILFKQLYNKKKIKKWKKPEHSPVQRINPLPDDKILDWSKLKQIANDILQYI